MYTYKFLFMPPIEECWKGHIVLPLSDRPSVSIRVRDGVSNLRLRFPGVSNLRLSFQAGGASVSFGHFSSLILMSFIGYALWLWLFPGTFCTIFHYTRVDKKLLTPCTLEMTKSRNRAIISQYNIPFSWYTFSNAVRVCLYLKNKSILPHPKVLINSIYGALIAIKTPTMKVSFQNCKEIEVGWGLNLENTGDGEGTRSCN